jgi:Fe-S-cluster containining protein
MSAGPDPAFSTIDVRGHLWPGLWKDLLAEEFEWMVPPRERRATCGDCYLVALGELAPDCQCCTYYPQIANFMVGLALKDPRSRPAMVAQIEAGGALPRELVNAPARFRRSVALYEREGFGQDHESICPFFDGGTTHCHVYPYRNSVCATFTCAHDHGGPGEHYWERLQQLVGHMEQALSQWAMDQLGVPHDRYVDALNGLADRIDDCSDPDTYLWASDALDLLWGERRGHEIEFFEQCADVVLEHRLELFGIASDTRLRHAIGYEQAVRDWMPTEIRDHVPQVAADEYAAEPIPSLHYKLQLAERGLWQLPFGDGPVGLAGGVVITDNPRDDLVSRVHTGAAFVARHAEDRMFLDPDEARALLLFTSPRILDGDLLERSELDALARPRESLAVWLRRGYLVEG